MNKPRLRWNTLFKEYMCHDRQPGEPISGRIVLGTGPTPESAYDKFVERLCMRRRAPSRNAPSESDLCDLESKRRQSLNVFKRIQRAFSHRANGIPRSWK